MTYQAGFIGAGNMGSALCIAAGRKINGDRLMIIDHNPEKMQALKEETGCALAADLCELAHASRFVFLAVKPNVIRAAAAEIAPVLQKDAQEHIPHILVTIAAGISIDTIKECTGGCCPVIRLMPNTPCAIGKGTTLITCSEDTSPDVLNEFLDLMSEAGIFEQIPEEKFDITSSISGCTPAYAYMFIEALADGAVAVGVPRERALRLAANTVLGAAAMVLESGKHPDRLKDDVCSPGGSTIAGVEELEKHAFRYAAAQSVIKSTEKNLQLGK